jgi:hypothetical protein
MIASMVEQTSNGRATGHRSSRGSADVKYQCQGLVPQADAPRLSCVGKTFEKNAASSGQIGLSACQKKVSMVTVRARPTSAPDSPAGTIVRVKSVHRASFVIAFASRYKQ